MKKVVSILLVLSLLLIGCSGNNEKKTSSEAEKTNEKTSTNESKYNLLSNDEMKVYKDFQKDLDSNKLKDVEPISIAKLYFQASIDKKHDVEYALYTDREELILWSKEEDAKKADNQRGTKDYLLNLSKNLDQGVFVQTSDDQGYIDYVSLEDSELKLTFKLIKNENGIWQVAFRPLL